MTRAQKRGRVRQRVRDARTHVHVRVCVRKRGGVILRYSNVAIKILFRGVIFHVFLVDLGIRDCVTRLEVCGGMRM